ncbi:hypothetical protein EIP86_001900 [Pleurotus ostreatoroseus]|nr:hypothetical protein EIP86_001900 [Pleurotus ostreatoroseus]
MSTATCVTIVAIALYYIHRWLTKPSLRDLRGPEPESFIMGSLREIFKRQAGEADFEWQRAYGKAFRVKASLGKRIELLAGEEHKRQRKVMLPAFGGPEIRALFPSFIQHAEQVSLKWKDMLQTAPDQSAVINVCPWLSFATMDAIGEAAFDYKFNATEDPNSPMVRAYNDFVRLVFGQSSDGKILALDLARYIPLWIIEWLQDTLAGEGLKKARETEELTTSIAKQLISSKTESIGDGERKRDVFSLLVKANSSEDEKSRFSENEMIAAMRTILFAGHETTSNSVGWALLELARNPDVQNRLRSEIHEMERTVRARGSTTGPSLSDVDQMPYTQAVIKETLRLHPVVTHSIRRAQKDDVIPLSRPVTTRSGKVLDNVEVPKGTRVMISIAGYNRDSELWGEDAHVFRPERWLDGTVKKSVNIGVYNNL